MKKIPYFTTQTIAAQSHRMLGDIAELRSKHPFRLEPKLSALLILDMQRHFLDETSHAFIPSAVAIIPGINNLIAAYSQLGLPVVFTRHINSVSDAKMMAKWWRGVMDADAPTSELSPQLDLSHGQIIDKTQYDAFYETPLNAMLQEKGVSQLVICGVMTHLCCETTARSAFVHGFEVFFTIDGTAAYNDSFHSATLLNLAHGFAVPVLIEELLADLSDIDEV